MELNLSRHIEGNKKSFYRYDNDKKKSRENMNPSRRKWETWLPRTWRRLRYLMTFFASVFTGKCRDWENEKLSTVEDQAQDHIKNLNMFMDLVKCICRS